MCFKKTVLALSAVAMATGCATTIKGTSEEVTINSLEPDTTLFVNGAARGVDSAFVSVKKGSPHTITAKKEGCQPVTQMTGEQFDATSLLGIFIDWGIITIPIDLISGAAWKVEPTSYTVSPICDNNAAVG